MERKFLKYNTVEEFIEKALTEELSRLEARKRELGFLIDEPIIDKDVSSLFKKHAGKKIIDIHKEHPEDFDKIAKHQERVKDIANRG